MHVVVENKKMVSLVLVHCRDFMCDRPQKTYSNLYCVHCHKNHLPHDQPIELFKKNTWGEKIWLFKYKTYSASNT